MQMTSNAEDFTFEVGGPGSTILVLAFGKRGLEPRDEPGDRELTTLLRWVDLRGTTLVGIKPHRFDIQPSGWQATIKDVISHCKIHSTIVHIHVHEVNDKCHAIGGLEVVTELCVCTSTVRIEESTFVTGGEVSFGVLRAGANIDVGQGWPSEAGRILTSGADGEMNHLHYGQ